MLAERPAVDLTQHAWQRQYGDITIYGGWAIDAASGETSPEPALILVPTNGIGHPPVGWVPHVIYGKDAWAWAEETGHPRSVARMTVVIARALGLSYVNTWTCMRITSAIRDCIGDLLSIPPKPTEGVAVADVIRTDAHGREHHTEVIERV